RQSVTAVEEIGNAGVCAAQLRDDIGRCSAAAELEVLRGGLILQCGQHDVVGDAVLALQIIAVDAAEIDNAAFGDGAVAAEAFARVVGEPVNVTPTRLRFADAVARR